MKYCAIKRKLYKVGFDDFHQAGLPNKFHPLFVVADSKILNLRFWICVKGGYMPESYHISSRPLDNINASSEIKEFKSQKNLIAELEHIRRQIAEAGGLR